MEIQGNDAFVKFSLWVGSALTALIGALAGIIFKVQSKKIDEVATRQSAFAAEVPKSYRSKEDCKDICIRFENSFNLLREDMNTHFKGLSEDIKYMHQRIDHK